MILLRSVIVTVGISSSLWASNLATEKDGMLQEPTIKIDILKDKEGLTQNPILADGISKNDNEDSNSMGKKIREQAQNLYLENTEALERSYKWWSRAKGGAGFLSTFLQATSPCLAFTSVSWTEHQKELGITSGFVGVVSIALEKLSQYAGREADKSKEQFNKVLEQNNLKKFYIEADPKTSNLLLEKN